MEKVKELNIKQTAEMIGTTTATLWNWKKHDDKEYRKRHDAIKIGTLMLANGFSYNMVYFLIKHLLKPDKQELIAEIDRLKKKVDQYESAMHDIADTARDLRGKA